MTTTLPGTTIEVSEMRKGISRQLFDGIFAAGGITLSQVSIMTDLEPYRIQNWVKRGFVSSPQRRQYTKNQFARIVIIHMLCESLQLDRICELLSYINGNLHDESDDIIGDNELYHRYTDMIAETGGAITHAGIRQAAKQAAADYDEPVPGARERLEKTLLVMAYAHYATIARHTAEETLAQLL